jgi:hypothetical protein
VPDCRFPERDIVGHVVGKLDMRGWTAYDLRTIAAAAGTDYLPRVYGVGWPKLVDLLNSLRGRLDADPFVGSSVRKSFEGHGVFDGTVASYDERMGFHIIYGDGDAEDIGLEALMLIILPEARRVTTALNMADYQLQYGSARLRSRFVAELAALNSKRDPEQQRTDLEATLWASYEAFEDPVSWVRLSGLDQAWGPAIDSAKLVGSNCLLYSAIGSPFPQVAPLANASPAQAAALCRGDLHPRARSDCHPSARCQPLDVRKLPEISAATEAEDEASVRIIKPSERHGGGSARTPRMSWSPG